MPDESLLAIRQETTPEQTIVYCAGRIVSSTADELRAHVKPLIVADARVLLDLSDVTFMDSMGLGAVATLWVSSKNARCQFAVVNLSRRLRDLFTVTHLLLLFEPAGQANARIP
jgi:anti-sigma B factor antagonist